MDPGAAGMEGEGGLSIVCISKEFVLVCCPNGRKRLGDIARATVSTSHKGGGEGAVASDCQTFYHNSAPHSLD